MPLDSIIPLNTGQRNMHEDVLAEKNLKRTSKCLKIDERLSNVLHLLNLTLCICKNDALEAAY